MTAFLLLILIPIVLLVVRKTYRQNCSVKTGKRIRFLFTAATVICSIIVFFENDSIETGIAAKTLKGTVVVKEYNYINHNNLPATYTLNEFHLTNKEDAYKLRLIRIILFALMIISPIAVFKISGMLVKDAIANRHNKRW